MRSGSKPMGCQAMRVAVEASKTAPGEGVRVELETLALGCRTVGLYVFAGAPGVRRAPPHRLHQHPGTSD